MNADFTLDERINGLVHDSEDILYKLNKLPLNEDEPIEIVTDMPVVPNTDIIIGSICRWREIQKIYQRPIRVYAWVHTTEVEKCLLRCVQNMEDIFVTTLPTYLRSKKLYGS